MHKHTWTLSTTFNPQHPQRLRVDLRNPVPLACSPVSRQLKTKIEKEGSKRELLGSQDSLSDSLCICCLQPFKFLVNSKRQCLDCRMFTCKACSRYNKKEHGWVCDNCRMTRWRPPRLYLHHSSSSSGFTHPRSIGSQARFFRRVRMLIP